MTKYEIDETNLLNTILVKVKLQQCDNGIVISLNILLRLSRRNIFTFASVVKVPGIDELAL